MAVQLLEIKSLPDQKAFQLSWSDGHHGLYPYDYLRGWCPCAGCQGHFRSQPDYQPPSSSVEPKGVEPVGQYALSILWSDGHGTGIYRFQFLRELCPCSSCSDHQE